jgi:hypothetical protein
VEGSRRPELCLPSSLGMLHERPEHSMAAAPECLPSSGGGSTADCSAAARAASASGACQPAGGPVAGGACCCGPTLRWAPVRGRLPSADVLMPPPPLFGASRSGSTAGAASSGGGQPQAPTADRLASLHSQEEPHFQLCDPCCASMEPPQHVVHGATCCRGRAGHQTTKDRVRCRDGSPCRSPTRRG